ncbi:MAG: tetratricopeptide repeat protein, partial [Pyrinomonadaceae bacterium]
MDQSQNNNAQAPTGTQFSSAADAFAEGNRLFDNGETAKAIDVLLQAVKLDSDLAEAHFKLGIA